MRPQELVQKIRTRSMEISRLSIAWLKADRRRMIVVVAIGVLFLIYLFSKGEEKVHYIYDGPAKQFKQERVIENPYKHLADSKIEMVEESEQRLAKESRELGRQMSEIKKALDDLKSNMESKPAENSPPNIAVK